MSEFGGHVMFIWARQGVAKVSRTHVGLPIAMGVLARAIADRAVKVTW